MQTNVPVYTQWEVAEAIGDEVPKEHIMVINPKLDSQANVIYLSTSDVAFAVVEHVGEAKKLGNVAIIAFQDHLYRCFETSHDKGMNAFAPEGYNMPSKYDAESGQPWTRDRETFVLTDMIARSTKYLGKVNK
jgi:hypothetical protein